VSHPHILSGGETTSALASTLGSDFQHAVAPFKLEILDTAAFLHGDVHRAAMRLLVERNGRRPTAMEQQLIIAALATLQGEAGRIGALDRAATRLGLDLPDRSQRTALQMHEGLHP
jgi:hypothetical protein